MLQSKRGQSLSSTRRLTLTAMFAALAFAAMFVFRFNVSFLTFDLKDAVITLAGLLLGPWVALIVSLIVAVLEFVSPLSDTGWYGLLMNFASSAAFSVACAVVYRYTKKLWGAVVALLTGVIVLVLTMLVLNLVVTPFYMNVSREAVASMIPALFLPFNAVKGLINASLVLILYKPIRRALQATRLMPAEAAPSAEQPPASVKRRRLWVSLAVSLIGLLLLAGGIAVFYFVLGGHFEFV